MSPTYISAAVIVFAQVLQWMNIQVGHEELTSAVTTIGTIGLGIWVMWRRYSKGGVSVVGSKTA